jgi:anti-sigma B factor antagonist
VEIRTTTVDSITVISLRGDLDSRSAHMVQEQVLPSLPADERILLDLSEVKFLSSAGLRAMLLVYRQAQCVNSSVALVGLTKELQAVLSATGFLRFFICVDDVHKGVAMLRADKLKRSGTT